jgi:hypothetical protein
MLALASNSKHYAAERNGHFPQTIELEIVLSALKVVAEFPKAA